MALSAQLGYIVPLEL